MPCLSGQYDPNLGVIINIGVLSPGVLTQATAPATQITTFPTLVDTGASVTCISPAIAQTLGLQPLGMRQMASATQSVPVNMYLVDLILPFGTTGYMIASIQVMEFSPAGGTPFQILVGRDILCRGAFTMSFDGHFTLCL